MPPSQDGVVEKTIPFSADIDILFVIDDSASTKDKQIAFTQNFKNFIDALDAFPTGRPNVHIGVVTSSINIQSDAGGSPCQPVGHDDGLFRHAGSGCSPVHGAFISDVANLNGPRTTNYDAGSNGGDGLEEAFSCIANVGDGGCGFESPLEAMKRALDGSHEENQGFLRDGAFLAVIILTDEDDCSTQDPALFNVSADEAGPQDFRCTKFAYQCDQPISPTTGGTYNNCTARTDSFEVDPAKYFQFLASIKDPSQIVVALVAGDATQTIMTGDLKQNGNDQKLALEPSCHTTIGGDEAIGRPAIRLKSFLDNFDKQGLFQTVCQSDYSQTLTDLGQLLFDAVSPCLEGDVDLRDSLGAVPGIQPDCTVIDVQDLHTDHEEQAIVHACPLQADGTPDPSAPHPCWWMPVSQADCPSTPTHLELKVERDGPPPTGTNTQVSCAVAASDGSGTGSGSD